jgi:uncharacterized repeat protein (TIGR03803 family)
MQGSTFRNIVALLGIVSFVAVLVPVCSASAREKILYTFSGKHTEYPESAPIFDSAGNLYGVAQSTKLDCECLVYKLTPGADGRWTLTTIYESDWDLTGSLVFDPSGNLYGETVTGGALNNGSVFRLTPGSNGRWTQTELYSFKGGNDGQSPYGNLVLDTAGDIFGVTWAGGGGNNCGGYGCGTAFELSPNENGRWTERVIYRFSGGGNNGPLPWSLALSATGKLYGTTFSGGGGNACDGSGYLGCGTVFELSRNSHGGWSQRTIYNFQGGPVDGQGPNSLLSVSADTLYGTTQFGCTRFDTGCAFELNRNDQGRWVETIIHRFPSDPGDGGGPVGPLALDAAGNVYGATEGLYYFGAIIFELIPSPGGDWKEVVLRAFTGGKDGGSPQAGITLDSAGNIYGTASQGGNKANCYYGCGLVFELMP